MNQTSRSEPIGWTLNPDYQVEFDPIPARVRVTLGGQTIGDSRGARVMYELGHAPIYYLPRDDVDMSRLEPTDRDTYCPYKGHASYWTVRVGDAVAENAIWTYLDPYPELAHLEGYLGYYWGRMEAWYEDEADGIEAPFPKLFGRLGDEYDKRYGLKDEHLAEISRLNYDNAKLNPNAQTRTWYMNKEHALCRTDDNPAIGGRIRIADCSQVTDGSVCVFLASEDYAKKWAKGQGLKLTDIPRIKGWGHNTARLKFDDKVAESAGAEFVLPHVRSTITSAWKRAGIQGADEIDAIETHDCFTTSEYMAIDHFGITKPGESWKAVEEGWLEIDDKHPINPSGGLIGAGHPVGATGVRQLLDCYLQVTDQAGDYQVEGATTCQTLNIGGSGTTSVSFVVGK